MSDYPEKFTEDTQENIDSADWFVGIGSHGCLFPTGDGERPGSSEDEDE